MSSRHLSTFIFATLVSTLCLGQVKSPSFEYKGTEKERSKIWDGQSMHSAGIGLLIVSGETIGLDEDEYLPITAELYYEYALMLMPYEEKMNVAAVIAPQIILPYMGYRLPLGIDFRLGSFCARRAEVGSRGLLAGVGYELVGIFPNIELTMPYARAGLAVENFFLIYQHGFAEELYLGNLIFGMKLEF